MRVAQAAMPLDARRQAAVRGIQEHVATIRHVTLRRGLFGRRRLRDRWQGASVQRAYQSLHAAKVFLVELLSPEDIDALAPHVVARVSTTLSPADPRRTEIEKLLHLPAGPTKRAGLQHALKIAYDASDQLHLRLRSFRNVLVAGAALILLLMAALVLIVALNPHAMPLCFTPPARTTGATLGANTTTTPPPATPAPAGQPQPTGISTQVCPSRTDQGPTGGDVVIVAGLGLLGGALAAAIALRKVRGTSTPYDVPIALALLKVPTGSLTAVAGIVLLAGQVVPGLSALDSQQQILAYALVLGYAQQAATRLLDDRAQTMLNRVPSKDPEARQPEPATTTPAPTPSTGTSAQR